jgi:hypothetical protein
VVVIDSLPCTAASRTIVDLARHLAFEDAVAFADLALRLQLVTTRQLDATRRAYERWPGAKRAQRVLDFASAAPDSPLESYSRALFETGGLRRPLLQQTIRLDGGFLAIADFLWAEEKTIGEADGKLKYMDPAALYAEKRREDRLREAGFQFVRWGWNDVFLTPGQLLRRLGMTLERASKLTLDEEHAPRRRLA